MSAARRRGADRGMVTAELATCLPVLVLVLGMVLSAVSVAAAGVRAQDAAREGARAAARSDPAAVADAQRVAPGASVTVSAGQDRVTVTVRMAVHPLGALLPAFGVVERASAAPEPAP